MSVADLIADMVRAGVDPELIGRTAQLLCEREAVVVQKRSAGAERQARYRERHKASQSVTSDVSDVLSSPLVPPLDKERSPTPPKEINPPLNPPTDVKRARASRLPEDWLIPPDWIDDAVVLGLSADEARREADRFRDFWIARGGKDALKANWRATWRNWCRNALQRRGASGANGRSGGGYREHADPVEIRNRLQRELADEAVFPAGGGLIRGP